ncbi:MAG: hypothetical protein LBB62_08145 [Proteiniphilum sp.]|jgi:hypothetical protein|nr:hypothetical protein [Proteiniphilum sp.]
MRSLKTNNARVLIINNNFLDELPTFLKIGMSIKLGDFGTLRLSLSSAPTAPEQFNA